MELQKIIKTKMLEKGINQHELAKMTNTSQAAINKIVTGKTLNPRFLPKLADALGFSIEEVIETKNCYIMNNKETDKKIYSSLVTLFNTMTSESKKEFLKQAISEL